MTTMNFHQFPQAAAALQMPLRMGKPVWALDRPSTRVLRRIRQERAALIKARPQLVDWVKAVTPQWVKDAMAKARKMVKDWKAAQMELPLGEPEKDVPASVKTAQSQAQNENRNLMRYVGEVVLPDERAYDNTWFVGGYRVVRKPESHDPLHAPVRLQRLKP